MSTKRIYLDNAATTPLDPLVTEAIIPYLTTHFGNPSSIHSYGRECRLVIEQCRKTIAKILGAKPSEIFFTSGGTESSNTAITTAVRDMGCKHIITSSIEHHATLHTVKYLEGAAGIKVSYVEHDADGHIDLNHLETLLSNSAERCLVTLMHANNEIGTMLDLNKAGTICKKYGAIFYSDTVQTVGHFPFELQNIPVDFISAAAHKFHGPKGIGILYKKEGHKINALIHGGGQERNMRAGTENVYGIVGFTKALEIATDNYHQDAKNISRLKQHLKEGLQKQMPEIIFNGDVSGNSLYTVLSVGFPVNPRTGQLLFNLDMQGICVSGGSACSGGDTSHVIKNIEANRKMVPIRFSFCKYNTTDEIERVIEIIRDLTENDKLTN